MITAIWSNDPEFYETILGCDDLLGHIFVKVNYNEIDKIIDRFGLSTISENVFGKFEEHNYICVIAEDTKIAFETIKKMIKDA